MRITTSRPAFWAICALLLQVCSCATSQRTQDVASKVGSQAPEIAAVNKLLEILEARVRNIVDDATVRGDYLLGRMGQEVQLAIANAKQAMDDEQSRLFRNIENERTRLLQELEGRVDRLASGFIDNIQRMEGELLLELGDIADRLPFVKNDFFIWRVKGYSQVYQADGEYIIGIVGNVFSKGDSLTIKVDEYEVTNVVQTGKHEVICFVPTKVLNPRFHETDIAQVQLAVSVSKSKKKLFGQTQQQRVFAYTGRLLLLPKSPFICKMSEIYGTTGWSKPQTASGETLCPATGKPKRFSTHSVSAVIPTNADVVGKSRWCDPFLLTDWGRPHDWFERTAGASRVIGYNYEHGIHDRARTIHAKVEYRVPVPDSAPRVIAVDLREHLPFGTYPVALSPTHQTYTLTVQDCFKREYVITPSAPGPAFISVEYEPVGETARRLVITLKKPTL